MNILCDYHHGELYESILKVFEDRIGANVYRPVGLEWYTQNYWKLGTNDNQVNQYLSTRFFSKTDREGIWIEDGNGAVDYYNNVINVFSRAPHKAVTFEFAVEMKWDIIITTLYENFEVMEDFRMKYCPSAKHILQLGNVVGAIPTRARNVMNSTSVDCSEVPNYVDYYQEFNYSLLNWEFPVNDGKAIYCFLIYNSGHRGDDFWKLSDCLSDWVFKEYGSYNKNGNIHKNAEQCDKIRESAFIWHVKLNGDGFGYNMYRSLYAGKPIIINYDTVYKHHRLAKLGFLERDKTFIEYDGNSILGIKTDILKFHAEWEENSKYIYNRIRDFINYDLEFEKIKSFIERLI